MFSLQSIAITILGISGVVVQHLTARQIVLMGGSALFSLIILPNFTDFLFSVGYFIVSTGFYLSLIFLVLPQHGLRLSMIRRWGEEKAFIAFEHALSFAFFHNAASLTHLSQSTANTGFWGDVPSIVIVSIAGLLFMGGFTIKIWSALVVGLPIYYWKDMFLGRPVSHFVSTGPYKYLSNPMYGVGQLQVYTLAIYFNSTYGLLFGLINQLLMFSFYYWVEYPFIRRIYKPLEQIGDLQIEANAG